ncbi:hypothetical protein BJX63DRAFT_422859 [Aspergillus granulosus]|uniref:Uncharacterized protein n=1 Tax=Aspergillus granulosus TaxID=176169 RepID=A0ABR4H5S8_9EURO
MAPNTDQDTTFAGLPPFPDDIPTAPLLRLSLKKLMERDEVETRRLNTASEELGFFYLNLRDADQVSDMLADVEELFQIGLRVFDLPLEEKLKYDLSSQSSYFGYKAQGAAIVDRQGNLDRNEFYNVSKDDIMGITESLPAPEILKNNRQILNSFIKSSHSIVTLILGLLNEGLGLPESTLTNLHRLEAVSGDQVRFIKAPPQPVDDRRTALGEHTDFGSVTILFNRLGGLQVLPPGADAEWVYVRPLPGHAIVNLGDAMVKFTNGLLRSNIHRVVSPPGEQADCTRYSLVYFSRPEDDVPLKRLEGSSRIPALDDGVIEEDINSKDWIIRRALGPRVNVPGIDYEKSAGTEVLSRRLKAVLVFYVFIPISAIISMSFSPSAFFQAILYFRLSSSTSSLFTSLLFLLRSIIPAGYAPSENLEAIARRRLTFLKANQDLIQPLVGNALYDSFASNTDSRASRVRPYVLVGTQPSGLRANLKHYQLEGLSWLLYLRNNGVGGILGDDMGLGKTLQTLAVFQHMKNHEAYRGHNTPIQNDLTELWSILRWLYPEIFIPSTWQRFEDAFSLKKGVCDADFLDSLTKFLAVVMLRRTKGTCEIGLNIPEKNQTIISVPLTDLQLGLYYKILTGVENSSAQEVEGLMDLTIDEWESHGTAASQKKSRISTNILMELRKKHVHSLLKCSIHPYLLTDAIPENYHLGQHVTQSSGKFIILQKMIRQFVIIETRKVVIFSGFDQALNLCEDLLQLEKERAPFNYVRLDGSTTSAWRNLSVFLFQNDPQCKVFLLSIRAGGEGLNLVSSSTVIFLDDDWNPQVMRQAESRVHRLGQTEPVHIYRLHSRGTVEDQMRRRLSKKAYLSDIVMQNPLHNSERLPRNLDFLDTSKKQAWLERAERVKTNIFNGEQIDTSSRSFSLYEETVIRVSKASRRIGKSRVVMVGEWEVSKESIEAASRPASQVGRLLLSCLRCPRAYCERCLDWRKTTFIGNDTEEQSCEYLPTSTFYIICAACQVPARKRQLGMMEIDTTKRIKHC